MLQTNSLIRECKVKKRETRHFLLRFKKTNDDKDKHIYIQKRSQNKSTIAEKKNKHKRSVHQELFSNKQNSRKFWDSVRKARQKKKALSDIEITKWETHFRNRTSMSEYHMNEICINELDRPISKEEVMQSIRNLKQGKAPGLDNICGEYLKNAEANITPFLTLLFNKIYDSSCFLSEWCKSIIIPLFKRGNETDPDNYRGISLLSDVSKVFTAILNKRLYNWAGKEGKISKEQAGFRKHYSTTDHIFTLTSIIKRELYSRKRSKVYGAFIDYKKAFDTVDRDKVWETLHNLETPSKAVKMI